MLNEVFNIIKMIELVKHRPGIYDFSTDEHNNRANVESLWKEVAEQMATTPAECRRKWASLRNALSRDLRNEREASLNKRKKKKWYLAEHLYFLRQHLNQKTKDPKGAIHADEFMEEEMDCPTEENKNFFDFSTQDVFNEYLSSEETNEVDSKNSFASVSSGVVNDTKHIIARPPPPSSPPHKISRRYISKSVNSNTAAPPSQLPPLTPLQNNFGHNYINDSVSSSVVSDTQNTKLTALPTPPPPQPSQSPHFGHNFMNESNFTNISTVDEDTMLDDRNMTFFKSIIPDILRLPEKKQRLYKQNVIMKLNRILDEQET